MPATDDNDSNDPQIKSFEEMCRAAKVVHEGHLMAFDPGFTTGFAHFQDGRLREALQIDTSDIPSAWEGLNHKFNFLADEEVDVVAEDYRIYSWKAKDHKWSPVHTVKVVGIVEVLCHIHDTRCTLRSAQQAKQFMTDEKLKTWNLWQEGKPHARDAIRHACYHILFGNRT